MKPKLDHPFLYVCTIIIGVITAQILINVSFSLEMKLFFVIYGTLWSVLASFTHNILEELDFEEWKKKW